MMRKHIVGLRTLFSAAHLLGLTGGRGLSCVVGSAWLNSSRTPAIMKWQRFTILVVEDDPNDRFLLQRAIEVSGVSAEFRLLTCGEEAIAYLKGEGSFQDRAQYQYPSILITDLKMPRGDGFSILAFLKSTPQCPIILKVVLSASGDMDDVKQAYMMGATAFMIKPLHNDELARIIRILVDFLMLCEVPQVDETGKLLSTESAGKLGERFLQ